jgi:hypothetical protein
MSETFARVIGQKTQGWIGHGSVLFLEFGELRDRGDGGNIPRGEWTLSSDLILWRVEERDHILGGSEDDRATMEAAIQHIKGRTLVAAELVESSGDSIFMFSGDVVLKTFVLSSIDDARWRLRLKDGEYVSLGRVPSTVRAE